MVMRAPGPDDAPLVIGQPDPWAGQPLVKGVLRQVRPRGPSLRFQLNPEEVRSAGGTGGWIRQARPGLPPALEWEGVPDESLAFTLLFDGWPYRSVERECRMLTQMGKPRAARRPPPELQFDYGVMGRGHTWVIDTNGLAWGEELRAPTLQRIRQEVTVTLIRYEEADLTLTPANRHKHRKGVIRGSVGGTIPNPFGGRVVAVRAGETLAEVAARELGSASRWPELAQLNSVRDPRALTVGQRLRLPEA